MKVDVLDKKGKKVESLSLDDSIFNVKQNDVVLAQYMRVFRANQRQGTASAKTRAEVSGGGRKPWRQKGTGRARHGSIRSPLWRTGGVTHGPKPKSWNITLPKKVKRLALFSTLSQKANEKNIVILKEFKIKEPKTSEMSEMLKKLKIDSRNILLILGENDLNIRKSASNISGLNTSLVDNVNAYEVMHADKVLFMKDAILKVQEKYEAK